MKVYRYILSRSFASVLGVLFIITSIDLVFNFFSQLEDINENYSYADALVFLLQSQPFRSREFIYLCSVVGLLVVFLDNNFLRAFNSLRQAGLKKINFALLAFLPIVMINLASYEYLVPDMTKSAFAERKAKVNQIIKDEPKMVEIRKVEDAYQIISEDISVNFTRAGDIELIAENAEAFKSLNYNSNLKYLRSSELVASSNSAFENYTQRALCKNRTHLPHRRPSIPEARIAPSGCRAGSLLGGDRSQRGRLHSPSACTRSPHVSSAFPPPLE